jgi:predicted transcriptional regulator
LHSQQECVTMSYIGGDSMKSTITVRLARNIKMKLVAISKSDHIPVSDLVRQALESMIAIRQFRKLRNQVLPFAEAQGFLTDDDVFNKLS